eukprot:scaffold1412_cov277-Chaetoceros_neogracile.AAC.6
MKFSIIIGMLFAKSAVGQQEVPCTSNDIVMFGGSFSDTGNLFAMTEGTLPPGTAYDAAGRFTNGRVWIEYLADLLKLNPPAPFYSDQEGTNYAIAGAASGSDEVTTWTAALTGTTLTIPSKGVRLQTQDFLKNCGADCCSSEMLFAIWAGAIDFAVLGEGPTYMKIIENIKDSIKDLIGAGATKILVLNLPQIASTPAGVGVYPSLFFNVNLPTGLADSVEKYNADLKSALTEINMDNKNVNIIHADITNLFDMASSNPGKFGLDDTKDTGIPRLNEAALYLTGTVNYLNADNAFWFDGVHPTTTFHKVLAESVLEIMTKSPKATKTSKAPKISKAPKDLKTPKSPKRA